VPAADALAVLDAIAAEQVPAAILRLSARLVAMPRPEAPHDLLTVKDAAALLRQTPRWVWRHFRELGVKPYARVDQHLEHGALSILSPPSTDRPAELR
jgi:hypothetical protein